jgi:hypothetical protein
MTCAPMKTPTYTSGVQSPDCGKYGMTCAESATTASAAPTSTRLTTGRSVATRVSTRGERLRVGARRASEVRTAAAFPAATAPVAASTTTVRAGYGYGYGPGYGYGYAPAYDYGYGYQPPYWGGGYGYYQPAPAAAPVVTGRSVAVKDHRTGAGSRRGSRSAGGGASLLLGRLSAALTLAPVLVI